MVLFFLYVCYTMEVFEKRGGKMANYKDDLAQAIAKCNSGEISKKDMCEFIYPFTTENISQYINFFDLVDRSLFTVGSSGDQTINAISKGANKVTLVDLNPLTKYYYFLKVAAILELNLDEILDFIKYNKFTDTESAGLFSKTYFERIKGALRLIDSDSYNFWNDLFSMVSNIDIKNRLFHPDNRKEVIIECNPYLQNEENSKLARERIERVQPIILTENVVDYSGKEKSDNIWLSNVAGHLSKKDRLRLFRNMLMQLNKDGALLMEYLYIYNDSRTLGYKDVPGFTKEIQEFKGSEGRDLKDAALIYRRVK